MPNPRVLQVIRPAQGGMRRHLSLLCAYLGERGYELAVAAPRDFALEQFGFAPVNSASTLPVDICARPNPLRDLAAARHISSFAAPYDLIHAHGLRAAWVSVLATQRCRKPFIFTAHNLAPRPNMVTRLLLSMAVHRAQAIICVSHAVAQSLAPYGGDDTKCVVISNGIALAPFDSIQGLEALRAQLGVDSGDRVLAAVGRLAPEKGFDTLIRALPRIAAAVPSARLVIAGDGEMRSELERLVSDLGVGDRVSMPGRLDNVPALLSLSELAVAPSYQEGQGLVALEAMACCRPVIASRIGGLVETVQEGVTGLFAPPAMPEALADAIITLLQDAPTRARMGQAGREVVERRYSLNGMIDATEMVYRSALYGKC